MSPNRRQFLAASAGLVAASLVTVPAVAVPESEPEPPQMVAVSMAMVSIRMSDGTTRTLTIAHDHPTVIEAIGSYSEWSDGCSRYEERLTPEAAEWAAHWLGSCGAAAMKVLNEDGRINAW